MEKSSFAAGGQGSSVLDVSLVLVNGVMLTALIPSLYLPLSLLLLVTALAEHQQALSAGLLVLVLVLQPRRPRHEEGGQDLAREFRGYNILMICIAILAVDFPVFPRRFCKTETYGVSLMDVGTGTTVVASALSSQLATGSTLRKTRTTAFRGLHVVLLAFARLAATKVVGYHEHASEYGSHWNFFATLCGVWALVAAARRLQLAVGRVGLVFVLCAAAAFFEVLLARGLAFFILHAARESDPAAVGVLSWFARHNREGLVSVWTHALVYLLAALLAGLIGPRMPFSRLLAASALCLSAHTLADANLGGTSRRLGNLPYILLVAGISYLLLATFRLCSLTTARARGPSLLSLLGKQSLPVFLAANVLTGAVNLGTPLLFGLHTHQVTSPASSLSVLSLYLLLLCGGARLFSYSNV